MHYDILCYDDDAIWGSQLVGLPADKLESWVSTDCNPAYHERFWIILYSYLLQLTSLLLGPYNTPDRDRQFIVAKSWPMGLPEIRMANGTSDSGL